MSSSACIVCLIELSVIFIFMKYKKISWAEHNHTQDLHKFVAIKCLRQKMFGYKNVGIRFFSSETNNLLKDMFKQL